MELLSEWILVYKYSGSFGVRFYRGNFFILPRGHIDEKHCEQKIIEAGWVIIPTKEFPTTVHNSAGIYLFIRMMRYGDTEL